MCYDAAGNLMNDAMHDQYDAEGNTIDRGSTAMFVYDAENRLCAAGNMFGITQYIYDPGGKSGRKGQCVLCLLLHGIWYPHRDGGLCRRTLR